MNTHWDLTCLYQNFDDPKIPADMQRIRTDLAALKELLQSGMAPAALLEKAIGLMNGIFDTASDVEGFVYLTLATDANHAQALALADPISKLIMEVRQGYNALMRYIATVEDLEACINANEVLAQHAFVLREMKETSAHLLPPAMEEAVLRMQLTGSEAYVQLRNQLEASMLIQVEGQPEKLSLAAVRGLAYSADPAVRKAAYEAELAAYPSVAVGAAACLNGIKGEALTLNDYYGYPSILDHVLSSSRMDRETLDAMLSAIQDSLPHFRRYMKAKAKLLGHAHGLPFYDLFAPVGSSHRTFTYEEAHDYLVAAMGKFSPQMGDFIDHAFTHGWIDAMPQPGKQGGAFCSGLYPQKMSRILSNFDGSFSAVSTLAHELGHAYHNLCIQDQDAMNRGIPMQLAETASIFNETFLAHQALAEASDEEAFTLLEGDIMENCQVIVDIYSRYLFETRLFEIRKERTLMADELCELMLQAQKDSYGDGLDPDFMHPYMWLCKSHYYGSHFYNFPYSFGMLFGKGVFRQYLERGTDFVQEYNAMLANCGVDSVAGVAARMGIDVRDKGFWATGLAEIIAEIDRFTALCEKKTR